MIQDTKGRKKDKKIRKWRYNGRGEVRGEKEFKSEENRTSRGEDKAKQTSGKGGEKESGKNGQKRGGTGGLGKREKSEVVERKEGNKKRKDGGRA